MFACGCFKIKVCNKEKISHIFKILLKSDNILVFKFINNSWNSTTNFQITCEFIYCKQNTGKNPNGLVYLLLWLIVVLYALWIESVKYQSKISSYFFCWLINNGNHLKLFFFFSLVNFINIKSVKSFFDTSQKIMNNLIFICSSFNQITKFFSKLIQSQENDSFPKANNLLDDIVVQMKGAKSQELPHFFLVFNPWFLFHFCFG